jgi:hypothetical protein
MGYGASLSDALRIVGRYVGRILKGEKPAASPVIQPTSISISQRKNFAPPTAAKGQSETPNHVSEGDSFRQKRPWLPHSKIARVL